MTATVPTRMGDLQEGDIVWTHGLRVQLGPVRRYEGINGEPVSAARGRVLNPEVFEDAGMRALFGGIIDSFTDPHWTVQSVDRLTWQKEAGQ